MFFDMAGVAWAYEQQPVRVDGENYLPDFVLWGDTTHEVKSRHEWERIQPPRVYLAGKMKEAHEWRGDAAVCERDNRNGAASDVDDWHPRLAKMSGATFLHVGPFSLSDDHGAAHCESAVHMAESGNGGGPNSPDQVLAACRDKISRSCLFCAHLNTADAFGTLVEIGYAAALGVTTCVTVDMKLADNSRRPDPSWGHCGEDTGAHDFWFAEKIANYGKVVLDNARARDFHADVIRRHTSREYRLISGIGNAGHKACMTFGDPLDVATHGETHEFGASLKKLCIANRGAAEAVRGHRFDAR
jgi:hypothetical protein